jgi:GT2 family glycosyltransferase/Flp pilus assembly protein TadD
MTESAIEKSSEPPTYDSVYYDFYGGVGPYRREGTIWLEHFKGVACQIVKWLRPRRTVEFGCALGFLVEALRDKGVDAWGADLSDFAIGQVREDIKPFCRIRDILDPPETGEHYDLVICIEVLEHLSAEEGDRAIANLCRFGDEVLFSSTPDVNHPDPTHRNVQPANYWIEIFGRYGYDLDPKAKVTFAAPHALLFRRRGALRVTMVCSSGETVDEMRGFCRVAGQVAEIGHLVTLVPWGSDPSAHTALDPRVRYVTLAGDNVGFVEELPYGGALIGSLTNAAAMISNAPPDRGRLFYLVPSERVISYKKASGNEAVEDAFGHRRISLSSWLESINPSSGRHRAELELEGWGFSMDLPGKFFKMAGQPKLAVGFLAADPDNTACLFIRLKSPLLDLHKRGLIELIPIQELRNGKLNIQLESAKKLDVLIVQRHFPGVLPYPKLMRLLSNHRPKIVYETDDALTKVPKNHIAYTNCCAVSPLIEEYVRKADLVTVSTEPLKTYFSDYNRNIAVIPNALDMSLWAGIWKHQIPHSPVRILFSGTMTHSEDLKVIEGALEKIIIEFGDLIRLLFWGNTSQRLQRYPQTQALDHFLPNYEEYARRLKRAEVDFAVIPLEDSPFNKAKSAIKWLEYSACGIPGIYSNVDAYNRLIEDGTTGILVNNTLDEWYAAIKKMIVDPACRQQIAANAQTALLLDHTVAVNSVKWLNAYQSLFAPVSIVIPLFNEVGYTQKCLDAIKKYPPTSRYEIIVIDNGSTDGTAEFLKSLNDPHMTVITNPVNLGFAKACNQGARAASHEYLLFLNNDTEPTPHWFRPLASVLDNDATVAAAGSKLVLPDGSLQHAGIIITDDRSSGDPLLASHIYYGQPHDLPEANHLRTYQAITAACLLVRRSAFEDVGGFDEKYWNGYEDVDLCFKLREKKLKLVYQPASVVVHHESKSGYQRFARAAQNISRLNSKWLGKIIPDRIMRKDGSVIRTPSDGIQDYVIHSKVGPELRCFSRPRQRNMVSIIMLTFNQLKYTQECIESLRKHTPEKHEVVFVDNGSSDETVKWLRKIVRKNPHYRLIENRKNLGFSKGCNQGIEVSTGEYILLLNNDVILTENWLARMLECLTIAEDIGIVGSMTNQISGPQKVPGVNYSSLEGLTAYARTFGEKNRYRRIPHDRIVGFCMLFRFQLVEDIGFLDERFGSGNFEDDDYCLRASLAGYRNIIAGDVFIHHHGSRSFIGNRIDYGLSLSGNRRIFVEKWSGEEVAQHFGVKLVVENASAKAHELFDKGGIEKATACLLGALKQAPGERSLYFKLAEMLKEEKRFQDSVDILEALKLNGSDPRQTTLLAYCEEALGHNDKAREYAESALAIDPRAALATNVLGVLAFKKGEQDVAEENFRKAIELDPGLGESYTNLGSLKWAAGETEAALGLFERGFILSPTINDVAAAYHAAVVETKSFESAEAVFREARALHPNRKRIAFFLIALLLQQEKHESALQEIEKAMIQFGIDEGILSASIEIRKRIGAVKINKPNKGKATLSLCMIVKNEEPNLARCLMSVKPVVDEMIVVDTGSTDRTKSIAAAMGAAVYDFLWSNDFSEARNFSLSKAAGDWILVLDADEVVSSMDHGVLRKITKKRPSKRLAYSMVTRNYSNNPGSRGWIANEGQYADEEAGIGWVPSPKVRLFVNDKRVQFVNPVHELVEPTLVKLGFKIKTCDIPVHHYGRLDQDKLIAKGKEYYRLGLAKIDQTNGDHNALKEFAIQASEIGEYEEAVKVWRKVIELQPNDAVAHMNMGFACAMLRQYEQAIEYSKTAMEIDPELREAALNYSGAEMIAGDLHAAVSTLEHILDKNAEYPPAMGRLAVAYIVCGRKEDGLRLIVRLNSKGFDCASVLEDQARAFMAESKFGTAGLLLTVAVENGIDNGSMNELLAECRLKIGGSAANGNPIDFSRSLQRQPDELHGNSAALQQQ